MLQGAVTTDSCIMFSYYRFVRFEKCDQAYSAICHVPPCGMNLGALLRLARSKIYSPFRLARQTSRLLGDIDRLPTGWFTLIVAPSLNGSGGFPSSLPPALSVIEVLFLSSRGLINVRGERWGGGNCEKLDDVAEVTDDERRIEGEGGDVGRGISLGENVISLLPTKHVSVIEVVNKEGRR